MWTHSYSTTVADLTAARIWKTWTDVNGWQTWQDDIEHARLAGEFRTGAKLSFRPKGGPNLTLELTDVRPTEAFTDVTRFPLARLYDIHELVEGADGVEVRTTLRLEGPLAFLWRLLVVQNIAKSLPAQTERLLDAARHG